MSRFSHENETFLPATFSCERALYDARITGSDNLSVVNAEQESRKKIPMSQRRWMILAGTTLISASLFLYTTHYLIFHDLHHILIFAVGDIAFVPIEVFLVAMIIERFIEAHEKQELRYRTNMVVGTFFTEMGAGLLRLLSEHVKDKQILIDHVGVESDWDAARFAEARSFTETMSCEMSLDSDALKALREFLMEKRTFIVVLLENPGLIEHESVTDMFWAIIHLADELRLRTELDALPPTDIAHLANDAQRAYSFLLRYWLSCCEHLQQAYPYAFSLVVRMHPFQKKEPDPVVR